MPGFLTHYLFSVESIKQSNNLPLKDLVKLHKKVYFLGAQGPDIFMYHFPLTFSKKRNLGPMMHKNNTNQFIVHAVKQIQEETNPHKKELLGVYMAGFISHYMLDSITHPYIYARTNYDPNVPYHYSHTATHCNFETILDANVLFTFQHKLPSSISAQKLINISSIETNTIGDFLSKTILETYPCLCSYPWVKPALLNHVLFSMKTELSFLHDTHGYKRKLFQFIENKTTKYPLASSMVPTDFLYPEIDSLNLQHTPWRSPFTLEEEQTTSFLELFQKAITNQQFSFSQLNNLLYSTDTKETSLRSFCNHLGNRSYNTGIDCNIL